MLGVNWEITSIYTERGTERQRQRKRPRLIQLEREVERLCDIGANSKGTAMTPNPPTPDPQQDQNAYSMDQNLIMSPSPA